MNDEIVAGIVIWGMFCVYILLPLCLMTWVSENTKWGRKFMDWLMKKMNIPEDYDE